MKILLLTFFSSFYKFLFCLEVEAPKKEGQGSRKKKTEKTEKKGVKKKRTFIETISESQQSSLCLETKRKGKKKSPLILVFLRNNLSFLYFFSVLFITLFFFSSLSLSLLISFSPLTMVSQRHRSRLFASRLLSLLSLFTLSLLVLSAFAPLASGQETEERIDDVVSSQRRGALRVTFGLRTAPDEYDFENTHYVQGTLIIDSFFSFLFSFFPHRIFLFLFFFF